MPLCYGGGVRTVAQAERIISLGVEKVATSAAALEAPELVSGMSAAIGAQSVVVVLDARCRAGDGQYEVWTHNGRRATGQSPVAVAKHMERLGAGEIVINSINHDGVMRGYDLELIAAIREAVTLPITALGGAGSLDDVRDLIARFGILGAAAGSLFVFKGAYRAVLINYPRRREKDELVLQAR
jgi:cyclase